MKMRNLPSCSGRLYLRRKSQGTNCLEDLVQLRSI